jgi:hypothetical protein
MNNKRKMKKKKKDLPAIDFSSAISPPALTTQTGSFADLFVQVG